MSQSSSTSFVTAESQQQLHGSCPDVTSPLPTAGCGSKAAGAVRPSAVAQSGKAAASPLEERYVAGSLTKKSGEIVRLLQDFKTNMQALERWNAGN